MIKVAALLLALCGIAAAPSNEPIQILVGAHQAVTVTIPYVDKASIVTILSEFFAGKNDEKARARFHEVWKDAGDLTLVITSKR
jgi:hypothetical protein